MTRKVRVKPKQSYRAFSYDVTAAILVYQAIPPGAKLYFYAKIIFLLANHKSGNTLLFSKETVELHQQASKLPI